MVRARLGWVLACLLASGALFGAVPATVETPLPGDTSNTTVHRLDNGLTVYLSPNPGEPRIVAYVVVRAGGAQDPAEATGLAHYLEHMLFKGTSELGTIDYKGEAPRLARIEELYEELFTVTVQGQRDAIYAEIDRENVEVARYAVPNEVDLLYRQLGFRGVNAWTSSEATSIVCEMPSNRAGVWAEVESARLSRPVFRLFQTEIETVFEEKNLAVDDPDRPYYEAIERTLYKSHPYSVPVLGKAEHLKNPSLRKVSAFFSKYYVPGNMAIVMAGDFDRAEMLTLVRKWFGGWKAATVPERPMRPVPPLKGVERVEVHAEAEEAVNIVWLTCPQDHPDAPAVQVMDMLMDNSVAGIINLDLNQALKVKRAGSFPDFSNEAGSWTMWGNPKAGQTPVQLERLLMGCLDRLKRGGFTDEDVRAVVTDFEKGEKAGLETNRGRVGRMTGSFSGYREWAYTLGDLDRLRAVTRADILRVARKYLGPDRVVAVRRKGKPDLPRLAKPSFTKIDIDPSRHSRYFRELSARPARPIEPRWVKEGVDYTVTGRPWGKVVATRNPFNDLFSLTWIFEVGERDRRGMGMAMDLLDLAGTGDLSPPAFKKRLYGLGTTLGMGSSERVTWVTLSGLDRNMEESIRLMRALFASPRVPPGALKKAVDIAIGAHKDNKMDPGYIFGALAGWAERGGESPVLQEYTDRELRGFREKPLLAMAKDLWSFKRKVQYVGTRPPAEVAGLIDEARKEYLDPPPLHPVIYVKPEKPKLFFAHRDMVQSQVGVFVAGEPASPDLAVDVGMYASYMYMLAHQEIREARAMAYSAWLGHSGGMRKGDEERFNGGLETQADKTIEATTLLRALMLDPPMSATRFAETKRSQEERYRNTYTKFRDIPPAVFAWEEQGVTGGDPRPARFERVKAYKIGDLESFAGGVKRYPLSIFILGNRGRVDLARLKELGEFEEKKLDELFPY